MDVANTTALSEIAEILKGREILKETILTKLLTAIISISLMSILCAVIFFPEELIGIIIFGFIIFSVLYVLGGIPMSLIISKYINLKRKSILNKFSYVIIHMIGGMVVTIIYILLTEPEHGIDLYFSNDMLIFYGIGIMSGLVFSLIEMITLKLRRKI
jgi:hypothetical protein